MSTRVFSALLTVLLSAAGVSAQGVYERVFGFFPTSIPGLVSDPPVVTTEDDGSKTYTNVSVMYYAPKGERVVEIKLKDFNLNPKNYEDEYLQVKQSQGIGVPASGRAFTFQDVTAFEKRKDATGLWILFLGDNVILEISNTGIDDDFNLITAVAGQLNIASIKAAFLAIRNKGRL